MKSTSLILAAGFAIIAAAAPAPVTPTEVINVNAVARDLVPRASESSSFWDIPTDDDYPWNPFDPDHWDECKSEAEELVDDDSICIFCDPLEVPPC